MAIKRILVPTDFSECARRAFSYACGLAQRLDVPMVLTHVYAPPTIYAPEAAWVMPETEQEVFAQLDQGLAHLVAQAREHGVKEVESHRMNGDPRREILHAARDFKCNLIVIGTHGRGALKHLLLGSVAEWVVRHAPCPVLVVGPHGDEAQAAS